MKKLMFVLISLSFLPFALIAQKVKVKSIKGDLSAIQLPEERLNDDVKTYSTMVSANSIALAEVGVSKVDLAYEYLKLHGFEKVADDGDLGILLKIGEFRLLKEERQESVIKTKKGEEKEYYYRYSYKMPMSVKVAKGTDVLLNEAAGNMNAEYFDSPRYDTPNQAVKNRNKYRDQWIAEELNRYVTTRAESFYRVVNAKIGYMPVKTSFKLHAPAMDKFPQYEEFAAETKEVKTQLSSIKAKQPISEEVKSKMREIIAKWETEASKISAEDKKVSKLKEAYISNMMQASFYIEDFAAAAEYANRLIDTKLAKAEGKKMLKAIEKVEADFARTGYTSRHMILEEGNYEKPVEQIASGKMTSNNKAAAYLVAKKEENKKYTLDLHEDARSFEGKIQFFDGSDMNAVFVVDYSIAEDVVFYRGGNITAYDQGETLEKMKFNLNKIASFTIGDRTFFIHTLKGLMAMAKGDAPAYRVLEEITATDKITLLKEHPTVDESVAISLMGDFWMKKQGGDFTNLAGVKFMNFKKALSKYLADCPDLSDRAKNGAFKRNLEDLLKVVAEYSACK